MPYTSPFLPPALLKPSLPMEFRKASFLARTEHYRGLAYALNEERLGYANPGELAGERGLGKGGICSPENVQRMLEEQDGIDRVSTGALDSDPSRLHLFSAWVRKDGLDCLYIRRDNNGLSYKPGLHNPTNLDDHGKPVQSLTRPALPDYPHFAGVYALPDEGVLYFPRLDQSALLKYSSNNGSSVMHKLHDWLPFF